MRGMTTTIDEFARIIIGADSIIYSSIYTTNPTVVVFHEKTSKYSVFRVDALVGKVHVVDLEANDFSFTVANIAPGSQLDQIVVMSEDGRLFIVKLKIGERATIENIIEEFSIGSSAPVSQGAFKYSEVFIPVFIDKKVRGVLLASNIENMEEFWFFFTHGETLFEYPFDAVAFNFYINEARKGVSVLYVDYESIVLIQYDPNKVVSQSDTVFNIDFGVECHDEIVDMLFKHKYGLMLSINNRVITLWSPEAKYEYAADLLRFYTKTKDQPYDECYPTANCRYAFVRKNGRLHHVNFSFGRIHESPLNSFLEGTDDQPIFDIQSDAVIYHLVHQKMFLVEEDFKYRLCLDNDEQKILTYSIHQGNLRGGDYFENLDNPDMCPPELRNKLLSALNLAKVTVLDSRIEQMKEQQRELSEKKQHRFFTKVQDLELLNELFSSKNYTDFAIKYQRPTMAIFFHVKTRFGLPRCNDHRAFTKDCDKCQKSLRTWRTNGLKVVETASYRTSTPVSGIEPVTMESLSSARQLGYYKRRMRESTYALCEMNKQLGLPEEIISGALKILAEYTAKSTWVGRSEEQVLVAALYIELKRRGNEMRAKDLLLQAERMTTCSRDRFKSNIRRVVQEIQRALGIRFIPQSFEDAFLKSRLAHQFSPVELSAICAYLRALDARPRLTSGKARTAFIGAAIYSACKRIGARAWVQSRCGEAVGATEVTIRNRMADIQPFENQITDDDLRVPVQRKDLDVVNLPTDEREDPSNDNGDASTDDATETGGGDGLKPQLPFTFDDRVAAFEKLSSASNAILGLKKSRLLEEDGKTLEKNIRTLKDDRRCFNANKPAEKLVIDTIDRQISLIEQIITQRGDEGISEYFERVSPPILKAHGTKIERIISHVNSVYTSVDAAREIVTKFFIAPPFIKNELTSLVSSRIRDRTLLSSTHAGDRGGKKVGEQNKAILSVVDDDISKRVGKPGLDEKKNIPSQGRFPSEVLDEPPEVSPPVDLENNPPKKKTTPPSDAEVPSHPGQRWGSVTKLPTDSVEIILKRKKSDFIGTSRIELVRILSILEAEKKKFSRNNHEDMLVLIRIAESIAIIKQVIAGQILEADKGVRDDKTEKPTTDAEKVEITDAKDTEKRFTDIKDKEDVSTTKITLETVEATSSLLGLTHLALKKEEGTSTSNIGGKAVKIINPAEEYMKSEFKKVVQVNHGEIVRIVNHVNQYYSAKDAARDIFRRFCKVSPEMKDHVVILITEMIRNKDAIDTLGQKLVPPANSANPMPEGLDYGKLTITSPKADRSFLARLKTPALRIVRLSKQGLQEQKSSDLEKYIDILKKEKMRFNPRLIEDREIRDFLDRTILLINHVKKESFDQLGQRFIVEDLPKIIKNNMVKIKDIISHVNAYYTANDAARDIVQKYVNGSPIIKGKATDVIAERIKTRTLYSG